jgi:hypothetical protein
MPSPLLARPRDAMTRRRPEQAVQRFEHLRIRGARGVFAFHVPNGGARSPIEAKILKGQGVVPGVPDVIAINDETVKAVGGRLSAAQRAMPRSPSELAVPQWRQHQSQS